MIVKCTMLIEGQTGRSALGNPTVVRTTGWSESWYAQVSNLDEARKRFGGPWGRVVGDYPLCMTRAGLLPREFRVIGQRYAITDAGVATSSTSAVEYHAPPTTPTDIPAAAVQIAIGPFPARRAVNWIMRGVPDIYIVEGEYTPTPAYRDAMQLFFAGLRGFGIMRIDKTPPMTRFSALLPNGNMSLISAPTFVAGATVRAWGINPVTRRRATVIGVVESVSGNAATISGYRGPAITNGWAQVHLRTFQSLAGVPMNVVRATVRRTGRPFALWRGRRSTRTQA